MNMLGPKNSDKKYEPTRHELTAFLENVAVSQHCVSREGVILWANPAELNLLGYSHDQYVGSQIKDYHVDEDVLKNLLDHLERREPLVEFPVRLRCRNGSIKQVMINSTVSSENSEADFVRCFCQDVTQQELAGNQLQEYAAALKTANQNLEQLHLQAESANRAKSEFLANMSHELRSPLTAILGFSETLLYEGDLRSAPKERVDAINTILSNGEHLLNVINSILDLSKIEAGKLESEQAQFSPFQISEDVVALLRGRADTKGIDLGIDFIGKLPKTILGDPTQLRQMLINVIGNAIKFTERGSVRLNVSLSTETDSNPMLKFDVIHTGIGMTQEQIKTVFNPFCQADTSMTRRFGGTGLGLAITKRLAELHGGTISVTSQPGHGSTFCITISPGSLEDVEWVDKQTNSTPEKKSERPDPPRSDKPLHARVLLAEDGIDNQKLIAFLLTKAGAEVTIAENGLVAYEKTMEARDAGTPYDVILMDMQMPVLDGYESVRRLRQEGYEGPIVALTAHAMTGDREKCLSCGCNDYATKPISREQLVTVVNRHHNRSATDLPNV